MSWLFYAILSPAIVAIVAFIDKYLLANAVKDYRGMPIYQAIMASIFGGVLWIVSGFQTINSRDGFLILLSGVSSIWASAIYFKVIAKEEASRVLILIQIIPIFVLILSAIFLQEMINLQQFCGFLLILAGTLGITMQRPTLTSRPSQAFLLMLLASFGWAVSIILFKLVLDNNSFIKVVSYESFGIALGGLILYLFFPTIKHAFLQTTKTVGKSTLGLLFFNEGLYLVSKFFGFLAVSMGSVSLVSVIGGTSVFFGILYGWILTIFAPHILKEDITKKELLKKICLAFIVFIGIILVT